MEQVAASQVIGQPQAVKRPEQRTGDQARHGAEGCKRREDAHAPDMASRRAQEYGQGLHPALHPARTLPHPVGKRDRRVLIGRGIDRFDQIAETREAQAEVGVLGDVPGVPAKDPAQQLGAEMIRRAPQRHGHAERAEARIDDVEQRRIAHGEEIGEPGFSAIVDGEPRLEAGHPWPGPGEGGRRRPQLLRLRPVLGVIDRQQLPRAPAAAPH